MEDLKDYFEPVEHGVLSKHNKKSGFIGHDITFISNFDKPTIVLIGVDETRNAYGSSFLSSPNNIRLWLYQLATVGNFPICDLGNLKRGKKVKDTYASLQYVVSNLLNNNAIPIIFGGSHDLVLGGIKGIVSRKGDCNAVVIDSRADVQFDDDIHSQSFFHKIKQDYGKAVELSLLAYQSYFVSKKQVEQLNAFNVDLTRLGSVRSNFNDVEPIFRDADIVSFDMSAIRYPDFEASANIGPNGLYAEEACQLGNVAGLSDKLQAFVLSEYNSSLDSKDQSAHLAAQILWHVMNGISQRKGDYPSRSLDGYKKIFVNLERPDTELVFYQNENNQRYWIEIPIGNEGECKIISCSEKDYKEICNNILPDRIWRKITEYLN